LAGIGFELKKLFKTTSVVQKLRGSLYAAMTTIGPLILIIVTLFLMYFFLGYADILFSSKDILASTILYVFIFSLCSTAPFNAVLSRYIADKIYENCEQDILPSYYAGLGFNIVFSSIFGTIFCLWEFFVGKVDAFYVFSSFCMYITLVFVFYTMLYITAIKEFKKISYSFVTGMLVALILAVILVKLFGVLVELGIVVGFAVGFLVTGFCLCGLVRQYFKENSRNYREVFDYFKEHWRLLLTNTFYIFGLYVHNFVFWTSDMQIIVVKSFVSAPVYDMATCIAMFINVSAMVIFIVEVETNFHEKYQNYCQTLIGGTGEDIAYAKSAMFRSIRNEIFFTMQLQVIFTICLFFICLLTMPFLSISGMIMTILPTLAVAYFAIFIMYAMIIFIYYFNVYDKAVASAAIFFGVTFVGSILAKYFTPNLYGLGVLFGAFAGLTYAFYALRSIEKNLDYYIFCKGKITKQVIGIKYGHKIYENTAI